MMPRRCDWWEDDLPTRGSKLNKLAEIEKGDGPVERKSHCLVCHVPFGQYKNGARGHLHVDLRFSSIVSMYCRKMKDRHDT